MENNPDTMVDNIDRIRKKISDIMLDDTIPLALALKESFELASALVYEIGEVIEV